MGVGLAVGALVAGGLAYATIPSDSTSLITACMSTSGTAKGTLRVIDAEAGATCRASEKMLRWSTSSIRWRGIWNAEPSYIANDAVTYNGSAFVAKRSSLNVAPTPGFRWGLMASGGGPGPQGPPRADGADGAQLPQRQLQRSRHRPVQPVL